MLDIMKEHFAEFAADAFIKRVLPSLIAAWVASLTQHLRWVDSGRPIFSETSVQAIVGLAIIGVHYMIHLWFYLKRRAAEAQGKEEHLDG